MSGHNFEKLDEKKVHHRAIDDETLSVLKNYYNLESHEELLKFIRNAAVKDHGTE